MFFSDQTTNRFLLTQNEVRFSKILKCSNLDVLFKRINSCLFQWPKSKRSAFCIHIVPGLKIGLKQKRELTSDKIKLLKKKNTHIFIFLFNLTPRLYFGFKLKEELQFQCVVGNTFNMLLTKNLVKMLKWNVKVFNAHYKLITVWT